MSTDPLACARTWERAPAKQWASRDALIQSAGSISNSARCHSDANIALGPILKMYIPGQIRIFNALKSDGYSTGNAPPSGNNVHIFLFTTEDGVQDKMGRYRTDRTMSAQSSYGTTSHTKINIHHIRSVYYGAAVKCNKYQYMTRIFRYLVNRTRIEICDFYVMDSTL